MKRAGRIGTIATASLVAMASLGASQPPVEEQSQTPNEPASSSAEPVPSVSPESGTAQESSDPEPGETDQESDGNTANPPPPVDLACDFQPQEGPAVDVVFQDDVEYDEMVITIGGVRVKSESISGTTVELSPGQVGQDIELRLLDDGEPKGSCADSVPELEPSETPSDDASDSEQPPVTDNPDPSETPTTPAPEDPTTPSETPSTDAPGSVVPPPPSQAPSDPPSSPQQTAPAEQAPPASAPSRTNNWDESPQNSPEPTQRDSSQQSEPEERNIRQYSQNPRHLLSQLLGTDSHNGSRLIMPRPRDAENESPELETLPPVSEDELNAIKARHSAPENGNGLGPDDELVSTDGNTGLSTAGSVWLWSGGTCTVLVGLGIWWALSRRKPQH